MKHSLREQIERNLRRVRERIVGACERSGRKPDSVELVAVVKYARLEWVRSLVDLGVVQLAENRPQQLEERVPLLPPEVRWHLIGHLQSNKVRRVLPLVKRIHSVDSEKLLLTIRRIGLEIGASPELLLEVNLAGEASKQGFSPEELLGMWERVDRPLRGQIRGLMTMAPNTGSPDDARRTFAELRRLREELNRIGSDTPLTELSMGMTGDFEIAIEEGATEVRIGSALFEGLE